MKESQESRYRRNSRVGRQRGPGERQRRSRHGSGRSRRGRRQRRSARRSSVAAHATCGGVSASAFLCGLVGEKSYSVFESLHVVTTRTLSIPTWAFIPRAVVTLPRPR